MGNTTSTTNLNIDYLFEKNICPLDSETHLIINVILPWKGMYKGKQTKTLTIDAYKGGISVINNDGSELDTSLMTRHKNIEWKPKSHLRDFEVHYPFTKEEIRIPRWGGIGCIMIDALKLCITIYATGSQNKPQYEFIVNKWNLSFQCKTNLNKDLSLGYDVLYIRGSDFEVIHLCEDYDDRDKKRTKIFAPGIDKDLGKTVSKKRARMTTIDSKINKKNNKK